MAYKCHCDSTQTTQTVGRYIGKHSALADNTLTTISKLTKSNDPFSNHYDCPWNSYKNPLWAEVMALLKLKEMNGSMGLNDSTPNIVFEAAMHYQTCFSNVDSYVHEKEVENLKKERSTSQPQQSQNNKQVVVKSMSTK